MTLPSDTTPKAHNCPTQSNFALSRTRIHSNTKFIQFLLWLGHFQSSHSISHKNPSNKTSLRPSKTRLISLSPLAFNGGSSSSFLIVSSLLFSSFPFLCHPNRMKSLPLHKLTLSPCIIPYRIHAFLYACAIAALLGRHLLHLLRPASLPPFFLTLAMLAADLVLALMWALNQSFRWRPVRRRTFPENLSAVLEDRDFPGLDVFICTADPYKEPPMGVVNTALSVMAYDYPSEKICVYVSDDGGSMLTLFAFMEAARFARHWLPFCRENRIDDRCPEVYFGSGAGGCPATIKEMYESMWKRVERALERGQVNKSELMSEDEVQAVEKWTVGYTKQDHPTMIQVLLDSQEDVDVSGVHLPSLVYVSREKRKGTPHNFKAGALNVLLRASGAMTNAPVILTLDCDMYSKDPSTPRQALCYLADPDPGSGSGSDHLGYVQFPQRFQGIDHHDIYACEHKRLYQINPAGMDGLVGPAYVGSNCFFRRQSFYGPPPSDPFSTSHHRPSIRSHAILEAAHSVASCTYEQGTSWGHEMGVRYESLAEDMHTSYWMQVEGWTAIFADPDRPTFLGDTPITLNDALNQTKRWGIGQLQMGFTRHNPLTYGPKRFPLLMGMGYAYYTYWSLWAIPVAIYGLLPQLALVQQKPIFPKLSDPSFFLYVYLFMAGYGEDCADFVMWREGTFRKWWSDQRMWMIRGVSSFLFALIQFSLSQFGISGFGFNVTSKVVDDDQSKRHEQGTFDFGIASPLFVLPVAYAVINLISFVIGLAGALQQGSLDQMFMQLFISGFVVVNSIPIYEAMVLRKDKGRLATETTITSLFVVLAVLLLASAFCKL